MYILYTVCTYNRKENQLTSAGHNKTTNKKTSHNKTHERQEARCANLGLDVARVVEASDEPSIECESRHHLPQVLLFLQQSLGREK